MQKFTYACLLSLAFAVIPAMNKKYSPLYGKGTPPQKNCPG
jgi:hypothetical protein